MFNRGEMGIGMLILFIALLLTAAIAAGVLVQTTGSIQEKAISTGDDAQGQIATTGNIVEISATDGRDGNITDFAMIMRLVAGSRPVNLDDVFLKINTIEGSANLQYRGANAKIEKSNKGYNTWREQEIGEVGVGYDNIGGILRTTAWTDLQIDLDLDGANDRIIICEFGRPDNPCEFDAEYSGQYIYFNLSEDDNVLGPILDIDGNLENVCVGAPGQRLYTGPISIGQDSEYGFYKFVGWDVGGCRIDRRNMTIYHGAVLNEDFDDDTLDDLVYIKDNLTLTIEMSTDGVMDFPLGADLSSGAQYLDLSINIKKGSKDYGDIIIQGQTSMANYIDENVTFRIFPEYFGMGYFVADYVQKSNNWRGGVFQQGDMVKIHFESPDNCGGDEELKIVFMPKNGLVTTAEFFSPNIISSYRVHVYP